MATLIAGDTNILYIHDTTYKPIACLTSNDMSSSLSVNETSSKCDPGEVIRTAGTFGYTLSGDGLYIDTEVGDTTKKSHDTLLVLQAAGTEVTWKLDTGLATTTAYYGTGFITDLTLSSPTGNENATFSFSISGNGTYVTVDPNGI